ncbi:MAG: 30S ribosomal protein S2 [Candidatus Woesebacteria bacterium GW2011_GWA1_37_8]|uniref:Small ribosomal subunit protein uS2 n=2 Tax=Candidatus Woeseibacteriota TaxID=1752722 RepID=A0A0G0PAT4_9BACT|nr:MAG: 30S ribosomal protein S2 [Microgenomates group bacterium GW2011_GWC1_37_12b]KKQ45659.1 MAG: 30S ribosomal protein S2 [Candidatus Woesebacteria bacterium GW2011_GWA1_37_8]KKQ86411.1 MAG: 30S ribosomal protein S2 [Candidatus Woesebacteria bacterium GW2011_GWB1_38_8b]
MSTKISLDELIKTGAHFGHQTKRWNPKMGEYLYGVKDGVHIFNLEKTAKCLEEALEFLNKSAASGKNVLFLGTKKQAKDIIKKVAIESGSYYVNERFLGGTFTNFAQIKRSTEKLVDMKKKFAENFYQGYTKKEKLLLEREVARLERYFRGIVGIKETPQVMVVVDIKREYQAIKEAVNMGVTVVALVDSNTDPSLIDYPIPMNDDATKALEYVLELMGAAIKEGREEGIKKVEVEKKKEEAASKKKEAKSEPKKTSGKKTKLKK